MSDNMFGPALRQLLEDLSRVTDRTTYEEALYNELSGLASVFGAGRTRSEVGPMESAEYREFQITIVGDEPSVLELGRYHLGKAAGYLQIDPIASRSIDPMGPGSAVSVDLGETDVRRLRCTYRNCPNKRI